MQIKLLRIMCAMLAAFALVSCSTFIYRAYDGEQRTPAEIALLSVDRQIYVWSVDSYKTGLTTYGPNQKGMDLEIIPGTHKIGFDYITMRSKPGEITSTSTKKRIEATFDFKKGRKYELHYRTKDKAFTYQIIDVTDAGSKKSLYDVSWGDL